MAKKVPYCDISARIGDLSSVAREVYGSHAYIAGFYESTLVNLIAELPAAKQNEMMRIFQDRIQRLQESA